MSKHFNNINIHCLLWLVVANDSWTGSASSKSLISSIACTKQVSGKQAVRWVFNSSFKLLIAWRASRGHWVTAFQYWNVQTAGITFSLKPFYFFHLFFFLQKCWLREKFKIDFSLKATGVSQPWYLRTLWSGMFTCHRSKTGTFLPVCLDQAATASLKTKVSGRTFPWDFNFLYLWQEASSL